MRIKTTKYIFENGSILYTDRAVTRHGSAPLGARLERLWGQPCDPKCVDIGRDVAAEALLHALRTRQRVIRCSWIS